MSSSRTGFVSAHTPSAVRYERRPRSDGWDTRLRRAALGPMRTTPEVVPRCASRDEAAFASSEFSGL